MKKYLLDEELRKELINLVDKEINVIAIFIAYSHKNDSTEFERMFERTLLLKDIVTIEGDVLSDHMWLNNSNIFDKKVGELKNGDVLSFKCTPKYYEKKDNLVNIGFTKIKNIKKLN